MPRFNFINCSLIVRRAALSTTAFVLLCCASPIALAQTSVVVPNAQAAAEGNSNNDAPIVGAQRYQQVYASSQFSGPIQITEIRFRPDAFSGNPFSTTLSDIQINLSTTAAAPDGLSTTYANNVGADDTIVYARGPLSISSSDTGPVGGPKDFDIIITLTTPFNYNPASGNLLFDVRNYGGGTTTPFDAQSTSGDSVSRLTNLDVNGATGSADTLGLVAQFIGPGPSINIVKLTNGTDNNSAPGVLVPVGSTVTFTYIVTNPGNAPLLLVPVNDDNGTPGVPGDDFRPNFGGGDINNNLLLDTTETWTFTASKVAAPGQYTNTASVTGIPQPAGGPPVSDTDTDNHFGVQPPSGWTTTGNSSVTEDESNPIKPTYTNSTAAANAGSPAGTYILRYNITAMDNLVATGLTNTRLRVRFRDEGAGSRVTVAIKQSPFAGGAAIVGTIFDSDAFAPGGYQTQEVLMPALTFDFDNNVYWLEVTLTKAATSNQPGFASAQINQQ